MPRVRSKEKAAVIDAFKKRWHTLKQKPPRERLPRYAVCFQANTRKDCAVLADNYYGKAHVKAMCALSDRQILKNLATLCRYLELYSTPAAEAARDDMLASNRVVMYFDVPPTKDLLSGVYILFRSPNGECEHYRENREWAFDDDALLTWQVESYPSEDWAEFVGGYHPTLLGVLMKSTGEAFTAWEQKKLRESVVDTVSRHDCDELRTFEITPTQNRNQMVVYIGTDDPVLYRKCIERALATMSEADVEALMRGILELGEGEKKHLPDGMLKVASIHSHKRPWDIKGLKGRLIALLWVRQKDEFNICYFEKLVGKYLFGGRPCYHHISGKLELL